VGFLRGLRGSAVNFLAMPVPKRRLGQHFLTNPRILARIADALGPTLADTVIEIGPGLGGLTAALAARAGRVVAIEKDSALVPALRQRLPSVTVVEGDALAADWHALAGGADYLVAGNIPYNITSPLLEKALEPPRPSRVVFLVQREVGERVTAIPGTREYGALTVGVQACAAPRLLFRVAAGAFAPRPRVDSAVLRLDPLPTPAVPDERRREFRRLVVGLFGFRRKQLLRGLRELTGWTPDAAAAVLGHAGLDGAARPETLAVPQFAALLAAVVDAGWAGD
jgi:16S rRNA (adenine1518-N6/adenine1519-N6)-dimethyltransferase